MDKETFIREYKGVAIVGVVLVAIGIVLLMNLAFSTKQLVFRDPVQPVSIKADEAYTIVWGARNINRIGIALFKGDQPKYWIVENYPASAGKFYWKTFIYESGADYRLAIVEYPWKNGNKVAYSPFPVEIIGRQYESCDDYSITQKWPFLTNNYNSAKKIFVTQGSWNGNLGGIAGADERCKAEAQKNNYSGNFIAFLGSDSVSAFERITKNGVFIEAEPAGTLKEGHTCHRFVASSIAELLDVTRAAANEKKIVLGDSLSKKLGDVWYGRRSSTAETKCLELPMQGRNYAFSGTYTCQNWSTEKKQVYFGEIPAEADLPRCYNKEGKVIAANYFGASSSGFDTNGNFYVTGDTCDSSHRLLCIEQ
jgi:hypothetical protein